MFKRTIKKEQQENKKITIKCGENDYRTYPLPGVILGMDIANDNQSGELNSINQEKKQSSIES